MEKYTIKSLIGKGNYGSVFLALSSNGSKVVIKRVSLPFLTDAEKAKAFQEAGLFSFFSSHFFDQFFLPLAG